MNKKAIKILALFGMIPVVASANPVAKYYDPLFSNEPPHEHGMLPPPGHNGMGFGEHLPPYLHGVELTDVQKKSIKTLIQKAQDGMPDKEGAGINHHLSIQKQVLSKDYSDEKIAGLIKKQVAQHEENEMNMAKLDHAIFELLTAQQQQQVQSNLITFSEHLQKLK